MLINTLAYHRTGFKNSERIIDNCFYLFWLTANCPTAIPNRCFRTKFGFTYSYGFIRVSTFSPAGISIAPDRSAMGRMGTNIFTPLELLVSSLQVVHYLVAPILLATLPWGSSLGGKDSGWPSKIWRLGPISFCSTSWFRSLFRSVSSDISR